MPKKDVKIENTVQETPPDIVSLVNSFSSVDGGEDQEMLRIAQDYALQLTPKQIFVLNRLYTFGLDHKKEAPELLGRIELFFKYYLEKKHHHESGFFIQNIIDSLSHKKLVTPQAVKVNVMKD